MLNCTGQNLKFSLLKLVRTSNRAVHSHTTHHTAHAHTAQDTNQDQTQCQTPHDHWWYPRG